MGYSSKIVLDSISEAGKRITSFEIVIPRIVLAEFNTHRMFSRNSASSRAIPVEKFISAVISEPYIPNFTKAQKGMQGLDASEDYLFQESATNLALEIRDFSVSRVRKMLDLGVHKQDANRYLEPFMWHTVLVTATEWNNFFALRNHEMAHPAIHRIARSMYDLYTTNNPRVLKTNEWHLPYILDEEIRQFPIETLLKVCTARCSRLSYVRQDLIKELKEDITQYERLVNNTPAHSSPAEMAAQALRDPTQQSGNFRGWLQYRKLVKNEFVEG